MSITANKIKGIRAANCTSTYLAEQTRLHNDANILCLGSSVVETAIALKIVNRFLETSFEGGKHTERVEMINNLIGIII
jgi:ribose 5-phosphate isomerase B